MTQASLNYSKDSIGSIWTSPTTVQSNQSSNSNKMSNIWETSTTNSTMSYVNNNTAYNQSIKSDANQVNVNNSHRLIRPQDISCDVWSNHNGALGVNKAKEPVGSLWANPTSNSASKNAGNLNKNTTKPIVKCLNFGTSSTRDSNLVTSSTTTVSNSNASNSINNNINNNQSQSTAASSCLQLFSDEFLNYLNMIN